MHRVEFINAGMPFSMESNLGKRSTKYAKMAEMVCFRTVSVLNKAALPFG